MNETVVNNLTRELKILFYFLTQNPILINIRKISNLLFCYVIFIPEIQVFMSDGYVWFNWVEIFSLCLLFIARVW